MAESWLDSLQDVLDLGKRLEAQEPLRDETNLIDDCRYEVLNTVDHLIMDGERRSGMIKGIVLVKRKPGITVAQFRHHWIDIHARFAPEMPGLRRYLQCHTVDEAYMIAEPRWDGVTQIWYDDAAAVSRAFASPQNHRDLEDAKAFAGTVTSLWAQEHLYPPRK